MYRSIVLVTLVLTFVGIVIHFFAYARKRRKFLVGGPRELRRFSVGERIVHGLATLSFFVTTVTGFLPSLVGERLTGWWLLSHDAAGSIFAVSCAVLIVMWADESVIWKRQIESAIEHHHEHVSAVRLPRAARFTGVQKAFFWFFSVCAFVQIVTGLTNIFPFMSVDAQVVTIEIHKVFALLLLVGGIVHGYMMTIANPGLWRSLTVGYVSRPWAEHYRPLWVKTIDYESKLKERKANV